MNNDNMDKLIALLKDVHAQEAFDIRKYHHSCGAPSCIIGWCYTLHTGNDRVPVEEDGLAAWDDLAEMLRATQEYLNIATAQAMEIACGWEDVTDGVGGAPWEYGDVPFDSVIAYLTALKDDPGMSWQWFYDPHVCADEDDGEDE